MNSDNGARLSFFFQKLAEELVTELNAHTALIRRLEDKIQYLEQVADRQEKKIEELSQKSSQSLSIKIDGDIGERLDAIEGRVDELESREESHTEEDIRQWAREEADEALSNASFTVTVD
jgi:phage shock protein A